MIINIPNIFSLLRIILSPIIYFLLISQETESIYIGCVIYAIAAATDYLDGFIARKYGIVTHSGTFIDPLADKFLTASTFLAFVKLEYIPLWMVLIIIIRDFGTTFLRIYADRVQIKLFTLNSAKIKTFLQMIFIAYILILVLMQTFNLSSEIKDWCHSLLFSHYTYLLMSMLTLYTLWTFVEYLLRNRKLINKLLGTVA